MLTYANFFKFAALPDGTTVLDFRFGEDESVCRVAMTVANAKELAKLIPAVLEEHEEKQSKPDR